MRRSRCSAPFPQFDAPSVTMLLSPSRHKETKQQRRSTMATPWINTCSPYGMACIKCNHLLIAPKWSAYATKHEIHHFWSCDYCSHEIESGRSAHRRHVGAGQERGIVCRHVNTREEPMQDRLATI